MQYKLAMYALMEIVISKGKWPKIQFVSGHLMEFYERLPSSSMRGIVTSCDKNITCLLGKNLHSVLSIHK